MLYLLCILYITYTHIIKNTLKICLICIIYIISNEGQKHINIVYMFLSFRDHCSESLNSILSFNCSADIWLITIYQHNSSYQHNALDEVGVIKKYEGSFNWSFFVWLNCFNWSQLAKLYIYICSILIPYSFALCGRAWRLVNKFKGF